MTDLVALQKANEGRWIVAKPTRELEAKAIAARLYKAKARYQAVERQTGVPWPAIAVIHERESSQDWNASLAQGDPWNRVSVHVPAGRGPFASWEAAAIDALVNCGPFLARHKDWSIGGALTALETYNGIGYASRGVASPYLWAGTNQYRSGKYVRDGFYDPGKVDPQMGCAALLVELMAMDPSIIFTRPKAVPAAPMPPVKPSQPSITNPSPGSIGAAIASLVSAILSIFKRK